jgi:hypothetical protein
MILRPWVYEEEGVFGCFPSGFCVLDQTRTEYYLILIQFIQSKIAF